MIWIIADTHFGHHNIKEYCQRPDNYEKIILKNLKKINFGDLLIHLGDIALYKTPENNKLFLSKVPCTRWLLKGNHDSKSFNWYLENGWHVVAKTIYTSFFGRDITFSHEPLDIFEGINIHGHLHNEKRQSERHYPVSIEQEYDVINLEKFLTKYKK
jgi:calcineurin-like phosphoesterase family protein